MRIDGHTIKTVLLTLIVVAVALGVYGVVRDLRQAALPGQQAAAYLDGLIRLGRLPTGDAVAAALQQAQAGPRAPAPAPEEKKPEGK